MRRMQLASALFSRGAVRGRWIRRLTLLSVVAVLAACQSYKDGQSRTVGEFTDDARIQAAVKTALIGDDDIKGMSVNVEVTVTSYPSTDAFLLRMRVRKP